MSEESHEILDPRIADARERKAAAEARAAARRAEEAPSKAIRDEIDAAALAEAIADRGELGDAIATIATPAGRVIVSRPTDVCWRQAMKAMEKTKPAELEEAAKNLIKDHLVYPSTDAYFEIVSRYPGVPAELVAVIGGLARGGARALSGE